MALKAGKGQKQLPKAGQAVDDNGRPLDVEVPEAIPRGRGGRPKIRSLVPETVANPDDPEGAPVPTGRLVESTTVFESMTRASTLGKTLDDMFSLHKWEKRVVLFGMSRDRAIYSAAQAIGGTELKTDKDALDELVERAKEAGKGNSGSTEGTAFHALSERSDAGEDLSYLDERLLAGLAVYRRLIAGLKIIATETFVVNDALGSAGSFDRVIELTEDVEVKQLDDLGAWVVVAVLPAGTRIVVDLKTNKSAKWFGIVYAVQQAVYACGSVPYTHAHGRGEWPDGRPPSSEWALIMHVPVDDLDSAGFYWVDLRHGYRLAQLAVQVRDERAAATSAFVPAELGQAAHPPAVLRSSLLALIGAATSPAELRELYTAHKTTWNDECTAAAAAVSEQWRTAS